MAFHQEYSRHVTRHAASKPAESCQKASESARKRQSADDTPRNARTPIVFPMSPSQEANIDPYVTSHPTQRAGILNLTSQKSLLQANKDNITSLLSFYLNLLESYRAKKISAFSSCYRSYYSCYHSLLRLTTPAILRCREYLIQSEYLGEAIVTVAYVFLPRNYFSLALQIPRISPIPERASQGRHNPWYDKRVGIVN